MCLYLRRISSKSTDVGVSMAVNLKCVYVIIAFILLIMSFSTGSISTFDYLQSTLASFSVGGPLKD